MGCGRADQGGPRDETVTKELARWIITPGVVDSGRPDLNKDHEPPIGTTEFYSQREL